LSGRVTMLSNNTHLTFLSNILNFTRKGCLYVKKSKNPHETHAQIDLNVHMIPSDNV